MTTTIKFLQHMERQQPNKIQLQTTDINHSTKEKEIKKKERKKEKKINQSKQKRAKGKQKRKEDKFFGPNNV